MREREEEWEKRAVRRDKNRGRRIFLKKITNLIFYLKEKLVTSLSMENCFKTKQPHEDHIDI